MDYFLVGVLFLLIAMPGAIIFGISINMFRGKYLPWMWRIQVFIEFPVSCLIGLAIFLFSFYSKSFYFLGGLGILLSFCAIMGELYLVKSEVKKEFYLPKE